MLGLDRYCKRLRFPHGVTALILIAKTSLIVAVLALLGDGVRHLRTGHSILVFHGIVVAVIVAVLFGRRVRHKDLVGGRTTGAEGKASGISLHGAAAYDRLAKILTFGREGRFRESMLGRADLRPGEAVLDVACGTGTLALAAKQRVGPHGSVTGIDVSPEMIERARAKAQRIGADVAFVCGAAQELPFGDGQFDIVMGTLMLHHLPKAARSSFAREAQRVLKPGGRLLLIDFGRPLQRSGLRRLHRHGHVDMQTIGNLLVKSGFEIQQTGAVGKNLNYVRARPTALTRPGP